LNPYRSTSGGTFVRLFDTDEESINGARMLLSPRYCCSAANDAMGQCTKSLRDSPLRGGKSREAVASREETDTESTRSPRSTSPLLQRSTLDQAHQVDLRPVSDAAMARCWNDKIGLDE